MQLTRDQQTAYNLIELRILNQRYIEILDELNYERHPFKNQKLNQQLKGVYGVIDKETKKYDDMYDVSPEGTTQFYMVTSENAKFIMKNHLLDKSLICSFLLAHKKEPKAIEGIISKIITKL